MPTETNIEEIASSLQVCVSLLVRRMRHEQESSHLTVPQIAALARLERNGASSVTVLAKAEHISPQSMGATLNILETRGLIQRAAHPTDGRRAILSISPAGRQTLRKRQDNRGRQLEKALSTGFTQTELGQLMSAITLLDRLATEM